MTTVREKVGEIASELQWIAEPLRRLAVPVESLVLDPANARKHDAKNLAAITASLRRFGQRLPIVVQRAGMVVRAGNGRLLAARALGWSHIAAVVCDDENIDAVAFAIADNRSAELAEWDDAALSALLDELPDDLVADIGFDDDDLSELADRLAPDEVVEDEAPAPLPDAVSRRGDLWLLGEHRLLCGDNTSPGNLDSLLEGVVCDLLLTDPPYGELNIFSDGTVIGVEVAAKRRQYAPEHYHGNGAFDLRPTLKAASGHYRLSVIWGGQYFADILPIRTSWLVWDKRAGERSFLSDCELAWSDLPTAARVKAIAWQGMIRAGERVTREHPTQKPVSLMAWVLADLTPEANSILDLFSGSGTTIIAAEQLQRRCYAIEIEPRYVDVAIRRWQKLTGKDATLGGKTWTQVAEERGVTIGQ